MSTEIVEQLKNGVVVRLGDGTEVHCKPLMLGDAITFLDLWAVRADLKAQPAERVRARFMIAKAFHKAYPELADKITVADVEAVLPGFFWAESGAGIPAIQDAPTGTPPSAPTSPATAAPPT